MMSVSRVRCLAAVTLLIVGCGKPPKADVAGTVTVNGRPPSFEGLAINFMGTDGRPVAAMVAPDGTYAVTGVAVGEVRIGFVVTDPAGDRAWAAQGQAAIGKASPKGRPADEAPARPARPRIPERYRDPLKSGVTTATKPGANTYNIDLK